MFENFLRESRLNLSNCVPPIKYKIFAFMFPISTYQTRSLFSNNIVLNSFKYPVFFLDCGYDVLLSIRSGMQPV